MVTIWTYTLYQCEEESCAETMFYSGKTLVLLENRNTKMFRPRNQEMTTGNFVIAMVINSSLTTSLVL